MKYKYKSDGDSDFKTVSDLKEACSLLIYELATFMDNNLKDFLIEPEGYQAFERIKVIMKDIELVRELLRTEDPYAIIPLAQQYSIQIEAVREMNITEDEYKQLLMDSYKLGILEADGVDNWEFYMEGEVGFIAEALGISEEEARSDYALDDVATLEIRKTMEEN